MWWFCLRSVFKEYGWLFLRRMVVPHPVQTTRAFLAALSIKTSDAFVDTAPRTVWRLMPERAVVGVGFCMKPVAPPCPSGRFNHDCQYLEQHQTGRSETIPPPCRDCAIREIGEQSLAAGAALYIMTSARHILEDLYEPALKGHGFPTGLFVLCRYSIQPFAVGLIASGIHGRLIPFAEGACADYPTWARADVGDKDERTTLAPMAKESILQQLRDVSVAEPPYTQFQKRGHLLCPNRETVSESESE